MKYIIKDANENEIVSFEDKSKSLETVYFSPYINSDDKDKSTEGAIQNLLASYAANNPTITIAAITSAALALSTAIGLGINAVKNIEVAENKFGPVTLGEKFSEVFGNLFSRIKVTDTDIIIKGMNFNKFMNHIFDMYEEKRLTGLFDPKYKMFEEFKYKRKVLRTKRDMAIKNVRFKKFFALEVYNLFVQMYNAYGFNYYKRVAKAIKNKTFLKKLDSLKVNEENISPILKTEFKLNPLLPYQEEFVRKYRSIKNILDLRGLILSFDQGLGKTITSLGLATHLNKEQVVIACLKTTTVSVWANEICDKLYHIKTNPENKKEVFVFGDKPDRFGKFYKDKTKYIIVNFESMDKVKQYIDFNKNTIVIIDECQNFRNPNGTRWKELYSILSSFKNDLDVLPMSGTPIKAKPSEIVPSLMCIDKSFDEECAKTYTKCFQIDTNGVTELINQRFGLVIYRKIKDDVLSLPEKTITPMLFRLSDANDFILENVKVSVEEAFDKYYDEKYSEIISYKDKYEEYVNKYCSNVSSIKKAKYLNYLNATIVKGKHKYLHELTSNEFKKFGELYIIPNIKDKEELKTFLEYQTKYVRIHNSAMGKAIGEVYPPRIAEMFCRIIDENESEIIQMINDNVKKTCLFASRLEVISRLEKLCDDYGLKYVTITGSNANKRADLIAKFREDPEVDVLIAMNSTMGTGVTLIEANQEIIFGTPWRQADLDQLSDRIHRIGQTHKCFINIIGLLTPGYKNLYDRMDEILNWSKKMTDSYIDDIDTIADFENDMSEEKGSF